MTIPTKQMNLVAIHAADDKDPMLVHWDCVEDGASSVGR